MNEKLSLSQSYFAKTHSYMKKLSTNSANFNFLMVPFTLRSLGQIYSFNSVILKLFVVSTMVDELVLVLIRELSLLSTKEIE